MLRTRFGIMVTLCFLMVCQTQTLRSADSGAAHAGPIDVSPIPANADGVRDSNASWNPLETLTSRGGNCILYSRTSVCLLRVDGYPQPVAIFVPPDFDSRSRRIGVFLHGWVQGDSFDKNVSVLAQDFEIAQALEKARSSDLLILPYSRGRNLDYDASFRSRTEFESFLRSVLSRVGKSDPLGFSAHVLGHSGAFRTIGRILKNYSEAGFAFEIERVALLDATYRGLDHEAFRGWLLAGTKTLNVVYLPSTPTEIGANELREKFDSSGSTRRAFFVGASMVHVISESRFKDDARAHWLVVRQHLPRLLSME